MVPLFVRMRTFLENDDDPDTMVAVGVRIFYNFTQYKRT